MQKVYYIIFLGFWLSVSLIGYSQIEKKDSLFRIETSDGNEYVGEIISEDSVKIKIQTERLGEISLFREDIINQLSIENIKKVGKEFWLENPQATRYFWAPNGYALNPGEAYYQNVWIHFNQVVFGITENFSFGGGIIPLFIYAGSPTPIWITPKISLPIKKDKINIGAGALLGAVIGESEATFGILYGTSTFGSRDKNFSFGIGYGYAGGEMAKSPVFNISGMIRTGNRGYLLSENYIIPIDGETMLLASIGGRRIIRKVGLDFGLFIPIGIDLDTFVGLPWLGLSIPFSTSNKFKN